jgi:hypothetical protein
VVGALYEWQNRDKQRALDMIVQGKAEARRPEYPDDTLKKLAGPSQRDEDPRAKTGSSGT